MRRTSNILSILAIALSILSLAGCDTYLPDEVRTTGLVKATVLSSNIESFNPSGAITGAIIGHMLVDGGGGILLGGAIGGHAAAKGCTIFVRYENGHSEELSALNAQCRAFKAGDTVTISQVTRTSYVDRNGVKTEIGRNTYQQF